MRTCDILAFVVAGAETPLRAATFRLASTAAVVLLAGCVRPATQLLAVVETDIPSGGYGCIGVVVDRIEGTTVLPGDRRMFEVPATVQLPFSFGVTPPDGDPARRVQLTAEAWPTCADPAPGATPLVSRSLRTGFLREQTLRVSLFLADRCRDVACGPTQTCSPDSGVCVEIPEIPPEELEPTRPGEELPRPDAGVRADGGPRPDAGPRDGGPAGPTVEALTSDWVLQGLEIPTSTDPLTRVTALCATPTGVAIAGVTTKAASFGVDLATATPISTGSTAAIWVAHVAADGTIDWLRSFGDGAISSIDFLDEQLVITGAFPSALSLPPASLTAVDAIDAFAAALEPSSGATRWATSLGTIGGDDFAVGAASTSAGLFVASRAASAGPLHIGGTTPAVREGEASAEGMIAVLDPATGAPVRAIGLGATDLEQLRLHGDGDGGALLGMASVGRVTGLHAPVAGGGGHELAVARLDPSGAWSSTTYLEGCTTTTSLRVTRNVGAAWVAFTDAGCGALAVTLAAPGGTRATAPLDPGVPGQALVTLGLDEADGAPLAASLRAVALHASGGRVAALTADGSDSLYVGGWIGLPAGGATLDFGGGPAMFTRNTAGAVQSNGAAFLWSHGADGTFRGVDSWSNGGAGALQGQSDMVTGIAIDATGLSLAGWLHGLGFVTDTRIGGGTGYDVAFLLHAR